METTRWRKSSKTISDIFFLWQRNWSPARHVSHLWSSHRISVIPSFQFLQQQKSGNFTFVSQITTSELKTFNICPNSQANIQINQGLPALAKRLCHKFISCPVSSDFLNDRGNEMCPCLPTFLEREKEKFASYHLSWDLMGQLLSFHLTSTAFLKASP